jgi:NADH-quinone oxidoreductase subunit A
MLAEFLPILILIALAAIVCTVMVVGSWVLGPKKKASFKEDPYECGVEPFGSARERFPIKFYLTAILFVLFDIEVVFLWSWLTVFRGASLDFQIFSGAAVGIYMILWIIGDWYAISVGAIDWDEATSLAPEKLEASKTTIESTASAALTTLKGATK